MSIVDNAEDICLGDWVRDQYGRIGRVTEKHYCCPEDEQWLSMQVRPVTPEQMEEPWCSVLVHNSGAVVQPISTLAKLDSPPPSLNNRWARFYFREATNAND
jgi:hypothetical protein